MKNKKTHPQVLILIGPTAIGKTALSLELAQQFNCEIVSVDSMQVYRYMDIGTAKANVAERACVPHHLIDIVDPDEDYDAAAFVKDASHLVGEIVARGKLPLLTGGTGLYIKSLLDGIFPEAPSNPDIRKELRERLETFGADKLHEELYLCDNISAKRIHKNDTQRLLRALEVYAVTGTPWSAHLERQKRGGFQADYLQIGLTCEREKLYERINLRCDIMLEEGLQQEVESLLSMGYGAELKSMGSIGYRHMLQFLNGDFDNNEMVRLLQRDTRRYAKRQYTWFNKNKEVAWCEVGEPGNVVEKVASWRKNSE